MGKVQFLFFTIFLLGLTKLSLWQEEYFQVIIEHRLTCGEKKIWQNIKKSLKLKKNFLFLFMSLLILKFLKMSLFSLQLSLSFY